MKIKKNGKKVDLRYGRYIVSSCFCTTTTETEETYKNGRGRT